MNKPRTIKALAIVKRNNPRFSSLDIFPLNEEVTIEKDEVKCEVEIVFKRYTK